MNEWISVKDALPEDAYVIVNDGGYVTYASLSVGKDLSLNWYGDGEGDVRYHVTHWMPFPHPPTVEKEPQS